jgi:hypothetical protein
MPTPLPYCTIEPLESRIAPASLTFTDGDGDNVVITTTGAGTLTLGGNVTVTNGQLTKLKLTDGAFQNASVSIVATRDPVAGGDGRVNVGQIDATGIDLGAVTVDGDLAFLVAGSGNDPAKGLASLKVGSLGRMGTTTGSAVLGVLVNGKLGTLNVTGDIISFVHTISLGAALSSVEPTPRASSSRPTATWASSKSAAILSVACRERFPARYSRQMTPAFSSGCRP